MKKIILLLVIFISILATSCEDVIAVDLNNTPPKLVITAAINWKKGTTGKQQKITLSTTADFYNKDIPKVPLATVYIKNSSNITFNFVESSVKGEYLCNNFIPVANETYTLTVISGGNTYTATETLKTVASITEVIQNDKGGFTGDQVEIKTFYLDPANETNYYLYKYAYSNQVKSNFYVDYDEFFNGNKFFSISQNDELKKGDKIEVTHYGISKSYFNYMNILVTISSNSGGSPFQSPPATVRGNIINTTNALEYPLGYFSLSEVDTKNYIVE